MGAIKEPVEKGATRKTRKRARAQRKAERGAATRVAQLGFGPLRNRYPPMEPLSEDQVEAIHQASLKVIRDLGIEIMSESVRQAFARQGAKVDQDSGIVCADPQMILELVGQAYLSQRYPSLMHGVGLADEYPSIKHWVDFEAKAYEGLLQPGMVLCVESFIGTEGGREGVKLEEQVIITETGIERMSSYPFEVDWL